MGRLPNLKTLFFGLLALTVFVLGSFFVWQTQFRQKETKPAYTQAYRLVPEKISQSAEIPISLPPGVDGATATSSISFDPKDESVVLQFDSLLPPLVETDRFYGGNFHKTMKDYLKESSQVRRSKN